MNDIDILFTSGKIAHAEYKAYEAIVQNQFTSITAKHLSSLLARSRGRTSRTRRSVIDNIANSCSSFIVVSMNQWQTKNDYRAEKSRKEIKMCGNIAQIELDKEVDNSKVLSNTICPLIINYLNKIDVLYLSAQTFPNYGAYQTAINNISNEILLNHPSYYASEGDAKRRKLEQDKADAENKANRVYPNLSSYGGFGIGGVDK